MQPIVLPDATQTAALVVAGLLATVVAQFVKKATGQNDLAALWLTVGIAMLVGAAVAYQTGALNITFAWTNPILLIAQMIQALSIVFTVASIVYKEWTARQKSTPIGARSFKAKTDSGFSFWSKIEELWAWVKQNEPKFSRALGLVVVFWVALLEFARAQTPVLKELFWTLYPLVLELWKIIAG